MSSRTNEAAFTGWVERLAREHTGQLGRLAVREGLSGQDAIDATQEAFVTLLGLRPARGLSDTHDEALAFLSVIVRNAAPSAPIELRLNDDAVATATADSTGIYRFEDTNAPAYPNRFYRVEP